MLFENYMNIEHVETNSESRQFPLSEIILEGRQRKLHDLAMTQKMQSRTSHERSPVMSYTNKEAVARTYFDCDCAMVEKLLILLRDFVERFSRQSFA